MDKKIEKAWKNTNLNLNRLSDEQRIEKQLIAIKNCIEYNNKIHKKKKKVNNLIKNTELVKGLVIFYKILKIKENKYEK